jgi:Tol biopolymer transport system component
MRFVAVVALVLVAAAIPTTAATREEHPQVSNGRIAFVSGTHLFTITSTGGGRRQLTRGTDLDDEPAWSPNGRWIAFSRTERRSKLTSVYVIPATGGTPRLLVRGARSPSWSPTGRRLAVLRARGSCLRWWSGARGVWTVVFSGGKPRLASAAAWSSDWSRSGQELAVMGPDGIAVVNVASGETKGVSSFRGQPGTPFDWSPDNSSFVLVTGDGVITVSVVAGSARTVAKTTPGESCSDSFLRPKWSPDGRWIAYEEIRCVQEVASFRRSEINIHDADGVWRSTIDNTVWGLSDNFGPHSFVWSPNSRYLAFIDEADSMGESFLEVADFAVPIKRLTAGASGTPSWQRLAP